MKSITVEVLKATYEDCLEVFPIWFLIVGLISAIGAGVGLALAFIFLFVGLVYKFLTANIW